MAPAGLVWCVAALLVARGRADEHDHTYQDKEEVVLWMNTVGPYHNRQETYKYFSLPFCGGSKKSIDHYHETLGEALQGVELEFSGLDIKFKEDVMQTTYCEKELDKPTRDAFVYAIKNHYWYQMYIDDLPIWGLPSKRMWTEWSGCLKCGVGGQLYRYHGLPKRQVGSWSNQA